MHMNEDKMRYIDYLCCIGDYTVDGLMGKSLDELKALAEKIYSEAHEEEPVIGQECADLLEELWGES